MMKLPPPSLLALVVVCLFFGCRTTDSVETVPVSPEESALLANQSTEKPVLGKIQSREFLFTTLDQNLRSWRTLTSSGDLLKRFQIESLEEAMTRHVYLNFDTILAELDGGDPEYRRIAAASLGFSVIPAPDEPGGDPKFSQVHERAVQPLIQTLDEGDDALTQNALLALSRIASPVTPIELVLEILLTHHDENVRANAALALVKVLQPHHADVALSTLYAALQDESAKVRLHTVSALGTLHQAKSVDQVLGVFTSDDSPLVRANAARVLGQLGQEEAIPFLISGLKLASIRNECRRSLIRITGKDLGPDPDPWRRQYGPS